MRPKVNAVAQQEFELASYQEITIFPTVYQLQTIESFLFICRLSYDKPFEK